MSFPPIYGATTFAEVALRLRLLADEIEQKAADPEVDPSIYFREDAGAVVVAVWTGDDPPEVPS